VAIFQHALQFLQSESFQTHVGTIHRRAIGPLALNGTSAYTLLTRHLPAPTIGCLHRPPYKLTCSSRQSVAFWITSNRYSFSNTTHTDPSFSSSLALLPPLSWNLSLIYQTAVSIVMFPFKLLCYYGNATNSLFTQQDCVTMEMQQTHCLRNRTVTLLWKPNMWQYRHIEHSTAHYRALSMKYSFCSPEVFKLL
jgi:hypothetical protein